MTSVASSAAGARGPRTEHVVHVKLTPNDLRMIQAFDAWDKDSPTCSPKKDQIERGYGDFRFERYQRGVTRYAARGGGLVSDTTGPNVFKRLVSLGVIEHSRNGHCWLTTEGKRLLAEITAK